MIKLIDLLNEYEIKKPILFNTDSSKSKLWVDYNPKIRKIDGKELSLLNRVYSALKPVENRLDDSLRLSPSLDRVMMKYGYWEWIEDREILKALKENQILNIDNLNVNLYGNGNASSVIVAELLKS